MSDNPADSFRRELRETLDDAALIHTARSLGDIGSERVTDAIWPLIEAALEAARADERERLIFALGSLDGKDFMDAPIHHRAEEAHAWAAGHDAGVEAAAELARGGV